MKDYFFEIFLKLIMFLIFQAFIGQIIDRLAKFGIIPKTLSKKKIIKIEQILKKIGERVKLDLYL